MWFGADTHMYHPKIHPKMPDVIVTGILYFHLINLQLIASHGC